MNQGNLFDGRRQPLAKVSTPDWYLVPLTAEELAWSRHLGEIQLEDWKKTGARYTLNTPHEVKLDACELGARCEITVAKRYDLAFPMPYLRRFSPAPDFGPKDGPGLCVRGTRKKFYPMIPVRPQDGNNCCFVRVCEFRPGLARIHAYCYGRDAKRTTPVTNPKPYGEDVESSPVHMVPLTIDNAPNPIVGILGTYPYLCTLPDEILALCPRGYRVWSVR